jgi:hypothetical protein
VFGKALWQTSDKVATRGFAQGFGELLVEACVLAAGNTLEKVSNTEDTEGTEFGERNSKE